MPPAVVVLWAPAEGESKMNLTRLDTEQRKPEVPVDLEQIAGFLMDRSVRKSSKRSQASACVSPR
jgi:hypothetical protein